MLRFTSQLYGRDHLEICILFDQSCSNKMDFNTKRVPRVLEKAKKRTASLGIYIDMIIYYVCINI